MKFLHGAAAVFMVVNVVKFIDFIQGGIRYNHFMSKVDHTDFAYDAGKPCYTFHMKDGRVIKSDHDVHSWSFYWF